MTARVGIALPRGTRLHLAEEGSPRTLCARRHGRNPRHVRPGFLGITPAAAADCPACLKAAP